MLNAFLIVIKFVCKRCWVFGHKSIDKVFHTTADVECFVAADSVMTKF